MKRKKITEAKCSSEDINTSEKDYKGKLQLFGIVGFQKLIIRQEIRSTTSSPFFMKYVNKK
ncbi:hypothetical protein [Alkalihalobacillus pseudalcaliphilus]|uniref:hypothetical protein n=1 Tax=Alkalihalobacillus pseudalcaliphilus TaxID=79884 RepID=UPI00064DE420|nr:hypothetical protein [Alkalihalobacillus pseudalcaliphilus]KMK77388.1 hypothetical protein AB990_02610 [Alkalihalobacillus pseudalcaliphilus]